MKTAANRCLRFISLGKYQTTLYNKNGSAFMSSVLGGIITLILILAFVPFITNQLISTFTLSRYNLDMTSKPIKAYKIQSNGSIFEEFTDCNKKDCQEFKVKDFRSILGNYFAFVLYNVPDCS